MKTEYTDDDLQCVVDDICPVVDLEWYAVDIHGNLASCGKIKDTRGVRTSLPSDRTGDRHQPFRKS
jgi:hypothetical protein